jgi:ribonuclease HI
METPKTRHRLKIFFDGGCRPNPGRIETAVVVRGVLHLFDDLGHGTNSDAEWLALICALELMQSLSLTNIELIGDALEVIQQAQRAMSTGRAKHGHAAKFLDLIAGKPLVRIRWIKREQNLAGIALAARHPR